MKHLKFPWRLTGLALTDYFFPRLCGGCGRPLLGFEEEVCQICTANLPFTRMSKEEKSLLLNLFASKPQISEVEVLLHFKNRGMVQRMLHQLKYRERPGLAVELGKFMGRYLETTGTIQGLDAVVPVPLHFKKLKKRGYNQSERLAAGLTEGRALPVKEEWLTRSSTTGSQTKLGRVSRWQNAREAFLAPDCPELVGARLLLLDDVLTTGSTLDACAEALINRGVADIKLATLAFSK